MYRPARIPAAVALALGLAACGGSGGGGGNTGGSGAVTSSGTITGFGSFYVNDVRYTTTNDTEVEFEDEGLVTEDRLRLGMKVTIRGIRTGSEGTASRIIFDSELKGTIDAVPTVDPVNPKLGSFTVGGFQVSTNDDTVFDDGIVPRDLSGLDAGDVVEVSAFLTADGYLASRVELKAGPIAAGEFEVKGVVSDSGLNLPDSFEIHGVTIDVSGVNVPAGVAPGVLVEVEGDLDSGNVVATEVEIEDDLFDDDFGDEIELEGILTRAGDDIFIDSRLVLDPDELLVPFADGTKVEVELSRDGNQLVVREVEREVEDTVRTEDRVFSVNGGTFTTFLGIEITPVGGIKLEDDLLDDDDQITVDEFMGNLQTMNRIEAEGFPQGSTVVWTEIEREDGDDTGCSLRGHVAEGFADPELTIQGVVIDTTSAEFEADDDSPMDRGTFFGALAAGDVIEAKTDTNGDCTPGSMIADEVSFESGDD